MKKFLIISLSVLMIFEVYSQSEVYPRFENRKTKGYYNITQFALLMGNRPFGEQTSVSYNDRTEFQTTPSVTMVHGGMFNERWGMGMGVGFEISDRNLFPVFLDVRRTLRDNDVSPYFALKAGYAFSAFMKKEYDNISLNQPPYYINYGYFKKYGSFMIYPEIGVKAPLSEKADLLVTVAYRYQTLKSSVWNGAQTQRWDIKTQMNRLVFGVAIMFR